MKSHVALQMSIANVHWDLDTAKVYDFIESNVDDIQTYWLDPAKCRSRVAAAIDYVAVLGVVGSVASIASLLWMAYDKFIAGKKTTPQDDAGIYISIEAPDGTRHNFWLGNEYKDHDIFIEDFTQTVSSLQENPKTESKTSEVMSKMVHPKHWTRRK